MQLRGTGSARTITTVHCGALFVYLPIRSPAHRCAAAVASSDRSSRSTNRLISGRDWERVTAPRHAPRHAVTSVRPSHSESISHPSVAGQSPVTHLARSLMWASLGESVGLRVEVARGARGSVSARVSRQRKPSQKSGLLARCDSAGRQLRS